MIEKLFENKNFFQKERDDAYSFFQIGIKTMRDYIEYSSGKNDVQEWVEKNRIIYGKPFSYSNADIRTDFSKMDLEFAGSNVEKFKNQLKYKTALRPYLRQYINDENSEKTVIKCRQVEMSETEINTNLYLASTGKFRVRHVFPTAGTANQIGKEKVSVAVLQSPRIREKVKRPYNTTSYEFDSGGFYTLLGSFSESGGRGGSSDKITFDEYEKMNPFVEEIFSETLSHSLYGYRVRLSTPMFPNSGIDEKFQFGNKLEWFTVCPKCKKEQKLEFPENIINFFEIGNKIDEDNYNDKLDRVYIGCRYCGQYIDRNSTHYLNNSKWIPERKKIISHSSYRLNGLMPPWNTGKSVLKKFHSFQFKNQFWNEVMGYAYVDPSAIINRDLFERVIDSRFKNQYKKFSGAKNISIGIDQGKVSWVVVRANGFLPDEKKSRIIYVERIDIDSLKRFGYKGEQNDHADRQSEIIKFFDSRIVINDANGLGNDRGETLVKRFPTRVYNCFYDTSEIQKAKRKELLIVPQWNETQKRVTVSRLMSAKSLIREYEEERVSLPGLDPDVEEFIQHHCNVAFQNMVSDKGEVYEVVGKVNPSDHYFHADLYAHIGQDRLINNERDGGSAVGIILGGEGKRRQSIYEKKKEIARTVSKNTDLE